MSKKDKKKEEAKAKAKQSLETIFSYLGVEYVAITEQVSARLIHKGPHIQLTATTPGTLPGAEIDIFQADFRMLGEFFIKLADMSDEAIKNRKPNIEGETHADVPAERAA